MSQEEKLTEELKKLNRNLKELMDRNRFMVYSARPLKFIFFNFLGGIFRSIGSALGTALILVGLVYFLSLIKFGERVQNWLTGYLENFQTQQIQKIPSLPENLKLP